MLRGGFAAEPAGVGSLLGSSLKDSPEVERPCQAALAGWLLGHGHPPPPRTIVDQVRPLAATEYA